MRVQGFWTIIWLCLKEFLIFIISLNLIIRLPEGFRVVFFFAGIAIDAKPLHEFNES